jgi:uncharacterized paraquat-inducible protein A
MAMLFKSKYAKLWVRVRRMYFIQTAIITRFGRVVTKFLRTPRQRIIALSLALLILVSAIIPLISDYILGQQYVLSSSTQTLLGDT